MLKLVRGNNLPIGIDLGASAVKMAQLRITDGDYELLAAREKEIPRDARRNAPERMDLIAENIREMLKTAPFKGKQAVMSIPAEATFVHHVKLPRMETDHTIQALRTELSGRLPYDVSDAVIQYVVADQLPGEGEPMQELIAFAAPRDLVLSYLEMSRKAKLNVIAINVESCALVECFSRLFRRESDARRTMLFVDMGAESTQVAFSHGNRIVFARNLRFGGDDLDRAVAEGKQISVDEAQALRRQAMTEQDSQSIDHELHRLTQEPLGLLATELSKCLRYYESTFRDRAIERVIFLGGQAYDRPLCQSLAEGLNVPAQIGDPLLRVGHKDNLPVNEGLDQREPQPDWAVAIGLSIGTPQAA